MKQLQLVLDIKSFTRKQKTVEILNRMDQCVSKSFTEEIKIELTFEVNKNCKKATLGMKATSAFSTGIAWDKLDRFVETKSGKDTLHDTAEIAYQMRDVPMTNKTTIHSEKSTNCTYSLPLSQQPGIRQK